MADERIRNTEPAAAQPEPARVPQGPMNKPLLVGGVVVALLGLIAITELTRPRSNGPPGKPAVRTRTDSMPATAADITNFERQTQEEAQELARIQAQKEALQRTLEAAQQGPVPNLANGKTPSSQGADLDTLAALQRQQQLAAAGYYASASQQSAGNSAEQDAIERRKKEEAALHASNVALDFRGERHNQMAEQSPAVLPEHANTQAVKSEGQPSSQPTGGSNAPEAKTGTYDFNSAQGKMHRLFEGRIIETVLTNRINGAFAGPVNCMVTSDVYAHDNRTLLIPQGSRILGKVNAVANGNQQRLFVAFHRIIMPDGYSVSLDQFTGLNQVGETGLRDLVNHHYLQIFGTSLALASIGGVAQLGNGYGGFGYDPMVVMRSGISQSMAESSTRVLDHFLNQLPTFIVRERARVKIYLAGDLLLPAYQNHTMPGDL
jgi:type IV secretory pathway VirB10-like protein